LNRAVAESFNRITIDGDTSTNDACALIATGQNSLIINETTVEPFYQLVTEVCIQLAQALVRDGEGATKFITIQVEQGLSEAECLTVAYTIAHSPLVKTALFASDPNWGRILAAVGRSEIENLNINAVQIYLGQVCIVENGNMAAQYTEEQGQQVLREKDILIRVCLGRGHYQTQVWTCDFSYDYVRINAEYRT
jgi:glutamate N-acetyltransferase/amino-acid N-acetyltransferase